MNELPSTLHSEKLSQSKELPSATKSWKELQNQLKGRTVMVFLDYDGTLTPIVSRPEDAIMSQEMRSTLYQLSKECKVAIISGRDLRDVRDLVSLSGLIYAGSHGFDISGPAGLHLQSDEIKRFLPELSKVEEELTRKLGKREGVQIERKKYSIAVHYRNVTESSVPMIKRKANRLLEKFEKLKADSGKKVIEIKPKVDWDKGKAVFWIMKKLDIDMVDSIPMYIGDDLTDEDAFRALVGKGIGILVGKHGKLTYAKYGLKDPDEVIIFLEKLTEFLQVSSNGLLESNL
jgi:trehalose 6-phosphate phosphatase